MLELWNGDTERYQNNDFTFVLYRRGPTKSLLKTQPLKPHYDHGHNMTISVEY